MKTIKTIIIAGLFLANLSVNSQTISVLTAATPIADSRDGSNSIHIGTGAGNTTLSTGGSNIFVGNSTGRINTTGQANVFLGNSAGYSAISTSYNIFVGSYAGVSNNSVSGGNVMMGHGSGYSNLLGTGNTFLGSQTGYSNVGSYNVFIGNAVGYSETGSNKLYIDNSNTSTPLIWGDFANDQIKLNGKVGIGITGAFTSNVAYSNYKLFVTGGILTDEVRVVASTSGNWPDYVFAKNYDLKPLSEVEAFISKNGRLPNVPSACEVKEDGINVAEMARVQQEKIEELMLYIIEQNKRIEALEAKVNGK